MREDVGDGLAESDAVAVGVGVAIGGSLADGDTLAVGGGVGLTADVGLQPVSKTTMAAVAARNARRGGTLM